ncbi:hypothetical protein D3C72_1582060 [compost metagenome]
MHLQLQARIHWWCFPTAFAAIGETSRGWPVHWLTKATSWRRSTTPALLPAIATLKPRHSCGGVPLTCSGPSMRSWPRRISSGGWRRAKLQWSATHWAAGPRWKLPAPALIPSVLPRTVPSIRSCRVAASTSRSMPTAPRHRKLDWVAICATVVSPPSLPWILACHVA